MPRPSSPYLCFHPKAAEEEDIPKPKERTHFTVRLTEAKPVDKVKLIKEIKNYVQGINLVQVGPWSLALSPCPVRGGVGWGAEGGSSCSGTCVTALSTLTAVFFRPRSWWSPCPRKSKLTLPKLRQRRSKRPWRPWAALWFWSETWLRGLSD